MRFPLAAGLIVVASCRQIVGIDDVARPDGDPGATTVGFATATSIIDELSGTVAVQVVLAAPATEQVGVSYAFVDDTALRAMDFVGDDGKLVFEPGETQHAIEFAVVDDETDEPDETFAIRLASADGATLGADEHVVTIHATPFPRVTIVTEDSSSGESDALRVVLSLDRPTPEAVTVTYLLSGTAMVGADYQGASETTVEIPPNRSAVELVFPILQDSLDEADEQVIVMLAEATGAIFGADTAHVHTIVDDDPLPLVSFDSSSRLATEGTTVTAMVRLSAPSGREVRVELASSGDATYGTDFSYPMPPPIVFQPGEMQRPFPIDILADADNNEPDEIAVTTIGPVMNGAVGAPATLEIQIHK